MELDYTDLMDAIRHIVLVNDLEPGEVADMLGAIQIIRKIAAKETQNV